MKSNLSFLRDGIEQYDNDGEKSLFFYNNPAAKAQLIDEIITFSIVRNDRIQDPISVSLRKSEIMDWLDQRYNQYVWPAHEVHFHTSFLNHATCPYTCLNEISTILEKLIKEKFAS